MKEITTAPPSAEVESLRRALVERDVDVAKLRAELIPLRAIANSQREYERDAAGVGELRAQLRTALADVEGWKRRWSEVQPSGPDHDVAMYAGRVVAENESLRARLARVEPVFAKAQQWWLYPRAPGAIAELERAIDAAIDVEAKP